LFRGWPRDRIATLHSEILPLETDVCETYFKLGTEERRLAIPFAESARSWYRLRKMGSMDGSGKLGGAGGTGVGTIRYLQWLLALAGDGLPERVRLSRVLIQWVESFRPEVLYTLLGSLAYIRLVKLLQERFGIPVVIHMMDDWPEHLYRRGVFGPFLRRRMHREFRALLGTVQGRLGICDAMCTEYERRYGLPFVTFHNPVEESEWQSSGKRDSTGTPFRVVYYGTIVEVAQLRSLMDVGWAVHGLRCSGLEVEFWIHTQYYSLRQHRSVLETCPGIRIGPETGKDDFKSVITAADLLVLPVNFDTRSVRYLRLSFPAKLPAYMASGTPILAYGPLEMAQIRYLAEAGAAHVVTQRSQETLSAAIRGLITDEGYRAQIGQRAHDLALERHGATRVRAAFRSALAQAAATGPARQTVTVS
ncbi:MAG: hypothetical protein ACREJ8_10815, partial [Candidatus Methylomirabilales bacterium]